MARGVNKVTIIGNCCSDPELKKFDNGGVISNLSVATNESWKDKQTGEKKERAEFHRIVFNGRLAEIAAQYLRKGSKVYIEGSLRTRKYQDKQTGEDRYTTEIMARELQMLDSRQDSGQQGGQQQPVQQAAPQGSIDNEEDIPF